MRILSYSSVAVSQPKINSKSFPKKIGQSRMLTSMKRTIKMASVLTMAQRAALTFT